MDDTFLNDTWCLYFHDPDNDDWGDDSYHAICTMSTSEDFVNVHQLLQDGWSKGMLCRMNDAAVRSRPMPAPIVYDSGPNTGG